MGSCSRRRRSLLAWHSRDVEPDLCKDRAPYHLRDVGGAGDWATRYKYLDEAITSL